MKIKEYRFKYGTSIYFVDGSDKYYIERAGDIFYLGSNNYGDVEVETEVKDMTYREWLDEKDKTVHRAAHIENLMNIVVFQSEKEYKSGMRYSV